MIVKVLHDAKEAKGLAVIIDVFRAFTVEPYIINNNAKKLIIVGDKQFAYNLKQQNPSYILIGERNGIKLPNFDYGNSPSNIENIDFSSKTVVHTTSCGTQGIVRAINADEIITGSLVNLNAIVEYIKKSNYTDVSLVALARESEDPFPEDQICAEYIKALLENEDISIFANQITALRNTSGSKFFDKEKQKDFPERDFYLCTELNKFNFVLKIEKDEANNLYAQKIIV